MKMPYLTVCFHNYGYGFQCSLEHILLALVYRYYRTKDFLNDVEFLNVALFLPRQHIRMTNLEVVDAVLSQPKLFGADEPLQQVLSCVGYLDIRRKVQTVLKGNVKW